MLPEWVIVNWFDTFNSGEYAFWNRDNGWGSFETATRYNNGDLLDVFPPIEGAWVMKAFAKRLLEHKEVY
jgi:hypothetical protein